MPVVLGFDIPLWALLTMVSGLLCLWLYHSTYSVFKHMGIRHRFPLPIIGTAYRLFLKSPFDNDMQDMRAFGKVWGVYEGITPNLMVADIDMIKQICIKDFSSFTNRRRIVRPSKMLDHALGVLADDHWKHVRNSLTPTFTSGKLKQMVDTINDCGDRFIEHLRETESTPFVIKDFTTGFTMDVIASTAFGVEVDSQKDLDHPFLKHGSIFFGTSRKASTLTKLRQFLRFFILFVTPARVIALTSYFGMNLFSQESVQYFQRVANNELDYRLTGKESQKRADFVQLCADKLISLDKVDPNSLRITEGRTWSTKGITKEEITSNAILFFFAGMETTATALQFFFYQMAKSPDVQEKLYEHIIEHSKGEKVTHDELIQMNYLDWCLHEVLRLYPPAFRFDRKANADTVVNGLKISKGTVVSMSTYAVHHNPDYWPEPEKFRPERFAPENQEKHHQYAWIPFGAGNRSCIAMRLALLEVKLGVAKILKNFHLEKSTSTPDVIIFKRGSFSPMHVSPLEIIARPR